MQPDLFRLRIRSRRLWFLAIGQGGDSGGMESCGNWRKYPRRDGQLDGH
jgi:hypothetical protein